MFRPRQAGFIARPDGSEVFLSPGNVYAADHELVRDHPDAFEPADSGARAPRVFLAADEPVEPTPVDELTDTDNEGDDEGDEPETLPAKPGTRRARTAKESS